MATETRDWKELDCVIKKVAWIMFGAAHKEVEIKCDGPKCAQFNPHFKGCAFRQ